MRKVLLRLFVFCAGGCGVLRGGTDGRKKKSESTVPGGCL